jgi:hypothetical protein
MYDWSVLADIATVFAALATGTGAIGAFLAYRRSLRTKRVEWLGALQRQFFESDKYEKFRTILDYQIEPGYSELRNAVLSEKYHPLTPEFWRYLNFFEFIATLHNAGVLTTDELAGIFGYDLNLINSRDFISHEIDRPESQFWELPILFGRPRMRPGKDAFRNVTLASEKPKDAIEKLQESSQAS